MLDRLAAAPSATAIIGIQMGMSMKASSGSKVVSASSMASLSRIWCRFSR
jgi:hypothetical protein